MVYKGANNCFFCLPVASSSSVHYIFVHGIHMRWKAALVRRWARIQSSGFSKLSPSTFHRSSPRSPPSSLLHVSVQTVPLPGMPFCLPSLPPSLLPSLTLLSHFHRLSLVVSDFFLYPWLLCSLSSFTRSSAWTHVLISHPCTVNIEF